MIRSIKVSMDINRNKAIDKIISDESTLTHQISIDCNTTNEDIAMYFQNINFEFDRFRDECFKKRQELEQERKELESLMTHEIYEKGEELGLWKLKEKQKRLVEE